MQDPFKTGPYLFYQTLWGLCKVSSVTTSGNIWTNITLSVTLSKDSERREDLLSFKAIVTIYKSYIRPLMEYASLICGGVGSTAPDLLDRLHQSLMPLRIGNSILTRCWDLPTGAQKECNSFLLTLFFSSFPWSWVVSFPQCYPLQVRL